LNQSEYGNLNVFCATLKNLDVFHTTLNLAISPIATDPSMYISQPFREESVMQPPEATDTRPQASDNTPEFKLLLEMIRSRRDSFDQLARIPSELVSQMKRAGIFRSATPRRFGGDALAPHLFLPMVEKIGTVDGSAAWVAAFGSANTYIAALPVATQAVIYADGPDQVYAGGLYPLQPARRVNGGWMVNGRWKFASGCKGADWIGVGITVDAGGGNGRSPPVHMAVFPAAEVEIIEAWDVVGMQGTGSHDTRVSDKFVADEWICARGSRGLVDEPLYRYPALAYQAQVHAAVNLGLARAALDLAAEMAGGAKLMSGASKLADRAYFRDQLARSEAQLRAARLFYYDTAERGWEQLLASGEVTLDLTNLMRLSATHAAHCAAGVIQCCYRTAGMSVIHKDHRMQAILRDCLVVTQHAALSEATFEQAGGVLIGQQPAAGYP
jgi:alkylation response protein AidB-like acyl-CoA dehydrogenase